MSKSLVLIALTLAAIAFLPAEVSARPISVGEAQNNCQGEWRVNPNGTAVCAWCEKSPRGKASCHWIACDQAGCDQVDALTRKVPRPLR